MLKIVAQPQDKGYNVLAVFDLAIPTYDGGIGAWCIEYCPEDRFSACNPKYVHDTDRIFTVS
jgi:hypothetical protein